MKPLLVLLSLFAFSIFGVDAQNDNHPPVKIGLLVSENPNNDPASQSAVYAAELAINQSQIPASLFVRSCDGPWGVTSKQVVDFVYEDEVDILITSVDGRNAHLAEQVATKLQTVMIASRSSDPTLTQAYVSWLFRITPDDRKQATLLANEIFTKNNFQKVALLYPSEYNGTSSADYFKNALKSKDKSSVKSIIYDPLLSSFSKIISKIRDYNPDAILFLGRGKHTSDLITGIYNEFPNASLFGNQSLIEDNTQVSALPDGMFVITSNEWMSPQNRAFITSFKSEYGFVPGMIACHVFDAVNVAIQSVNEAGNDIRDLQDEVRFIIYQGVSGEIRFDEHGNRTSPALGAYIRSGKIVNQ